MASLLSSWRTHRFTWLLVGLSILAVYVVVPQLGSVHSSWHLIQRADTSWVVVALAMTLLTYFAAAATYYFLAFKPLRYSQLVLVQLAAMFVNKLLPAGIGALGANYAYLRRHGHDAAQAASAVAINNTIGVVGHLCILIATLLLFSGHVKLMHIWQQNSRSWLVLAVLAAVLAIVLTTVLAVKRFRKSLLSLKTQLLSYSSKPGHLLAALTTSISLTLANLLCLTACVMALNLHLSFVIILIVFSLGLGTGTVTPTPGGLGGFEAGLFAGFIAYHVPAPSALALALLYRLISYWAPLIAGALAFIICQKQKLFTA